MRTLSNCSDELSKQPSMGVRRLFVRPSVLDVQIGRRQTRFTDEKRCQTFRRMWTNLATTCMMHLMMETPPTTSVNGQMHSMLAVHASVERSSSMKTPLQ